jgi:hypothetical protein
VSEAVRQALEGRLGLRVATEARADAIVRGRVVRYDPDVPQSVQAGVGQVTVTKRKVQIIVDVEIVNQREGTTVWKRQGLSVDGDYAPPAELEGRKVALAKLVQQIVDGAQSQWCESSPPDAAPRPAAACSRCSSSSRCCTTA